MQNFLGNWAWVCLFYLLIWLVYFAWFYSQYFSFFLFYIWLFHFPLGKGTFRLLYSIKKYGLVFLLLFLKFVYPFQFNLPVGWGWITSAHLIHQPFRRTITAKGYWTCTISNFYLQVGGLRRKRVTSLRLYFFQSSFFSRF